MPDPVLSYERTQFGSLSVRTYEPGGEHGSFESFTNSVPTIFGAVKVCPWTSSGKMRYRTAAIDGSCSCPGGGGDGTRARGWR